MEKLAGDLLLELKFVRLEVLLTSFIDFLYEELGELRSKSLALKGFRIQQYCKRKLKAFSSVSVVPGIRATTR